MYCLCRSANAICVRIILLDETDFLHEIKDDLPAQALLDVTFARLNLIETCYFGLRYVDQDGQTHWLDPNTRISRQLKTSKESYELYFGVKFYAADPCKLVEEITRYQLYLQVKQDILQGRLPVSFELAAELGAYVVQSELGDYDARKHVYGYVSEFRFIANQTRELEQRICELHQKLRGMTPGQCELNYLDKVKWHDMYGVDLHPVLGEDSVEYFLGLTPSGIVVLRNKTTVAHYFWPRIAKVYFKGRYFMLRVCDKNNEVSTYGFETPKKSACKHLWKCCMEHHAFFRLVRVPPPSSSGNTLPSNGMNGDLFTIGSRFRSSAKNEKSLQNHQKSINNSYRIQPNFVRIPSRRQPRRITNEQFSEEKRLEIVRRSMHEVKNISIPQPVETYESPYRSTCSIPAALTNHNNNNNRASYKAPDSPHSSKSVPWMRSHQRGLFGINSSPKSVRSATSRVSNGVVNGTSSRNRDGSQRRRSSSVESHSSNDSRSGKKSRRRHRRISDNESEFSGRSGRSHNSHRKHRRHRSRSRRSGSENESRRRSSSNHSNHSHHSDTLKASSTASLELVDSGDQWLEAQRKQGGINGVVHQAAVVKSSTATKKSSNTDTSGKRKHRKHKSPSDRTKMWSSELARHLQFDLVETSGMTEDQLREIPYTVVETHQSVKKPTTSSLKVNKTSKVQNGVDRIRNYPNEQPRVNGSIRSESTISSSKDYDRNSGLIRMMSSLSMVDFISPSGSSISPVDSNGLRVSHEHTDSGLGADQDYAYSSERSSDSAKYTNKSSGASVASITTHSKSSHMSSIKSHHTVSSNSSHRRTKPPVCPNRHQVTTTNSNHSNKNALPAVHNSATSSSSSHNNCLHNNSQFKNNHYTFSLNRLSRYNQNSSNNNNNIIVGGGGGFNFNSTNYLDALPYHNPAACYYATSGTASSDIRTRATKSDIGVPISSTNARRRHHNRSYHKFISSNTTPNINEYATITNINNNNNSTLPSPNNNSTQFPTTPQGTVDYLENYKTASMQYYNSLSSSSHKRTGGPLLYLDDKSKNNGNYAVPVNSVNDDSGIQQSHQFTSKNKQSTNNFDNNMEKPIQRHNLDNVTNRSSSLELILTPIIQSRRAQ